MWLPRPGTVSYTHLDVYKRQVLAPFFTLSVSATAGGTVAGGGAYPADARATAVATADPGSAFSGWTGDQTGACLLYTSRCV